MSTIVSNLVLMMTVLLMTTVTAGGDDNYGCGDGAMDYSNGQNCEKYGHCCYSEHGT